MNDEIRKNRGNEFNILALLRTDADCGRIQNSLVFLYLKRDWQPSAPKMHKMVFNTLFLYIQEFIRHTLFIYSYSIILTEINRYRWIRVCKAVKRPKCIYTSICQIILYALVRLLKIPTKACVPI